MEGDIIRVIYESSGGAGVFGRMRLDSGSYTQNPGGINFSSGLYAEVSYNNTWGTTVTGGSPVGNISVDPLYTGYFELGASSPNLGQANPARWLDAFMEVAPYDLNRDFAAANLFFFPSAEDMGARERLGSYTTRASSDISVDMQGFDVLGSGDPSKPLLTLSKAFQDASGDPIVAHTYGSTGVGFSRTYILEQAPLAFQGASTIGVTGGTFWSTKELVLRSSADLQGVTGVAAYVAETGSDLAGDGSLSNPYRSIDHALGTSASLVYTLPGRYDTFTGVLNKQVVPVTQALSETRGVAISTLEYYSWGLTGVQGATGVHTATSLHIKHL
jgi:hypothetical protein